MKLTHLIPLFALSFSIAGCDNQPTSDFRPVETRTPPRAGDLNMGGMRFDAQSNITHLRDEETGEWLPLTSEESRLLTQRYRDLVRQVGRPKGYNP